MLLDALQSFRRTFGFPPQRRLRRRSWNSRPQAACERLEDRTLLSAFAVNTTVDTVDANPGDGVAEDAQGRTTLRAAVMEANALGGSHSISLGAGVFTLSIGGAYENEGATGDLDIRSNITLTGAGSDQTTIDGNEIDRVFDVHQEMAFHLAGVELTGGRAVDNGTDFQSRQGGAIRIDFFAEVTIDESAFRDNAAVQSRYASGGAIQSFGDVTIDDSVFENNFAENDGGAIDASRDVAITTIRNTTFANNTAPSGGAIYNLSQLTIVNSTFVDNTEEEFNGGNGGAINNNGGGELLLVNSTLSGNHSGFGGALFNAATATIRNCTIANNGANHGGGIRDVAGDGQIVTIENSIIAQNSAIYTGPDIDGSVDSLGHNLIGNSTDTSGFGPTDLLNIDPKIAPLADNGGPTWTHALLADSRAIDAANTATAPTTDQRGLARPQGVHADIGAFEKRLSANSAPVANFDVYFIAEDQTFQPTASTGVIANDTDFEGDALEAFIITGPEKGTITLNADGSFDYTPNADFHGTDQFVYNLIDAHGESDFGTVYIEVSAVNDAPTAIDDTFSVTANESLALDVRAVTDLYMESDGGEYVGQGQTYEYTDATATFIAERNFYNGVNLNVDEPGTGGDWWDLGFANASETPLAPGVYTDALHLGNHNNSEDRPGMAISGNGRGLNTVAGHFNVYEAVWNEATGEIERFAAWFEQSVSESSRLDLSGMIRYNSMYGATGGVLLNDVDVDRDILSATIVAGPEHGTLTLNADGSLVYTPDANFHGTDTFAYRVFDGTEYSNVATVTINVAAVNDVPVVTAPASSVTANSPIGTHVGTVRVTDVDDTAFQFRIVEGNADGFFAIDANGRVTVAREGLNDQVQSTYTLRIAVEDARGGIGYAEMIVTVEPLVAGFDAVTGSANNVHTLGQGHDTLSTAIMGSASLDVREIDILTLEITINGSAYSPYVHKNGQLRFEYTDLNGDGIEDLVIEFDLTGAAPTNGPVPMSLSGELQNGVGFTALDEITLDAKHHGRKT